VERANRIPWTPQTDHHVVADFLSNGYYVSTIRRMPELRDLDGMIGLLGSLVDPDGERSDLTAPGDFETMVFPADAEEPTVVDWGELDFRRYTTEEEARRGHEMVIEEWIVKSAR